MLPGRSGGSAGGGRDRKSAAQTAAAARADRAKRKADKESAVIKERQRSAATSIQRCYRKYTGLQMLRRELRPRVDAELAAMSGKPSARALYGCVGRLLLFCDPAGSEGDAGRLSALAKKITASLSADTKTNYCALCLDQQPILPASSAPGKTSTLSAAWQRQLKRFCNMCLLKLEGLPKGGKEHYSAEMQALIMLTDFRCWQLKVPPKVHPLFSKIIGIVLDDMISCGKLYSRLRTFLLTHHLLRDEPIFAVSAFTLALRPLAPARMDEIAMQEFAVGFVTIDALAPRLPKQARNSLDGLWPRLVEYLATQPEPVAATMASSQTVALAVVANCAEGLFAKGAPPPTDDVVEAFVQMTQWTMAALAGDSRLDDASGVLGSKPKSKKGGSKTYHPVFGWVKGGTIAPRTSAPTEDLPALQLTQLRWLWTSPTLCHIFGLQQAAAPTAIRDALDMEFEPEPEPEPEPAFSPPRRRGLFGGAARVGAASPAPPGGLSAGADKGIIGACSLYNGLCKWLPAVRIEVLAALCFALKSPSLIVDLWQRIDSDGGAHKHRLLCNASNLSSDPFRPLLELFLHCGLYVFTILDDSEVYEKQYPFTLVQLKDIALFCNQLGFLMLWTANAARSNEGLKLLCTRLLGVLFERDSRRAFVAPEDWFIADRRLAKEFDKEVMEESDRALNVMKGMPHVLPFERRVVLFRQWVEQDRAQAGVVRTQVTIRRTHVIEDALTELGRVDAMKFKSTWKIHFINEQGLDEAGIDESGLFREFVETACQQIFHPDLNLFSRTEEDQRMYPCEKSAINPEHLRLFHLAGRLFGRTVFEGIVADLPFANFFLAKLLHGHAFLDDLQSLDPDLYRNLIFVKHYDGDVEDLCLTFAVDEETFGMSTTFDLKPGGRAFTVNNQNRTSYIHLMADYYMNGRIREQCREFTMGFKEVIPDRWLRIFSTPAQLQRLVGGDENAPLDLEDLKKHVNYEGGYHGRHKVIKNLWQIVEELDPTDQGLFVKFVTSVSKPPLLGFQHLRPPFTIRYVPVDMAEKEEEGFSFKHLFLGPTQKTARLPTAATCFNTLKLPAYNKKSTLREKLLYSIRAGAGFELS